MHKDDSAIYLADAINHCGDKRRTRLKGYYVCPTCSNQFVRHIPRKEINCPVCVRTLPLVCVVDEFEVARIKSWSNSLVIIQGEETENNFELRKESY